MKCSSKNQTKDLCASQLDVDESGCCLLPTYTNILTKRLLFPHKYLYLPCTTATHTYVSVHIQKDTLQTVNSVSLSNCLPVYRGSGIFTCSEHDTRTRHQPASCCFSDGRVSLASTPRHTDTHTNTHILSKRTVGSSSEIS